MALCDFLPAGLAQALPNGISIFIFGVFVLYALYLSSLGVYNVCFHPLSKFPGPKLAGATILYSAYFTVRGQRSSFVRKLHEQYGEVVRTKPNELSFIVESAWKDIYMHRQGQKQMQKARQVSNQNKEYSIIVCPDDVHARQRRLLSHAFSERALREQEPLIQEYVSLLIDNMRQDAKQRKEVNMVQTFNLTTFDIVSDLSFGESFGGLKTRTSHPWIQAFFYFAMIRTVMVQISALRIPFVSDLAVMLLIPFVNKQLGSISYTKEKIEKRIDEKTGRPDFMSYVLRYNDEKGMSREEIQATFNVLMIAGSETTATLLSGCTYLLHKNPQVLRKLQTEIRGSFSSDEDITILKVSYLKYLTAVIEESLRLYPPVPVALNRRTPPEGAIICGHWVPGNVSVGIPQFAAYTSDVNFAQPHSFVPERMLQEHDTKFGHDRKAVLQPFSAGPRNCIGKNLAMSEMKLVLARIIFNSDLELLNEKSDWFDQKVFTLWRKNPLMMRIKDIKA